MKTSKDIYLSLEDVNSEHCALIVGKGLNKVAGITSAKVEFNNQRVLISTETPTETLPQAVQRIRDLGYNVPTIKQSFPVLGMSCAGCASTVQEALRIQAGVIKADVNYANATLELEYIPSVTDPEQLKQTLQSYGYDLMTETGESAQESLDALHRAQFRSLKRRTFGALACAIPLIIIGMTPLMDMPYASYIMWALATPVVFYFGKSFFTGAWKQARHRSANMDTLVALSTGTAYIFSVFNTLFPSYWHERGLHAHVYFEAAAVVIAFILVGKLLEEKAKGNTSSAIRKLMGLQPKSVTIIQPDGSQAEVPVVAVKEGAILLVKPGERIAVDGTVSFGTSYVDESMISGEPVPVAKSAGAAVFAGTINQKGSFQFRAEKVGGNTVLAQIIRTVREAQGSKAPVQKLVDKIAGIFVPIVIGIALLSFVVWILLGGENSFTHALLALVTVLVIACPCALGLATPTAIMVGVGKAAAHGILVKDAESLEIAKKINAIILDKTGTITEGRPAVVSLNWFTPEEDMLRNMLYTIEKSSEHPLADAIVASLKDSAVYLEGVQVENIPGRGIRGTLDNRTWLVGNHRLLEEAGIAMTVDVTDWVTGQLALARTVILFSDEQQVYGGIAIADQIKSTSKSAIDQLHRDGIAVYMLTGDNPQSAKAVAEQLGINHYEAQVLPAEKAAFTKKLQQAGKIVAMVGDGINDSNALAQADISIAMGKGSDIAIDVAKMTIISSDLSKIPLAIKVSRQTVRTIRQNLFWAFIYNILGIPLAAGILYPINGFLLDPMVAGAAMALSSVSVVLNSLRLKNLN